MWLVGAFAGLWIKAEGGKGQGCGVRSVQWDMQQFLCQQVDTE